MKISSITSAFLVTQSERFPHSAPSSRTTLNLMPAVHHHIELSPQVVSIPSAQYDNHGFTQCKQSSWWQQTFVSPANAATTIESSEASSPPTKEEIATLRQAFAAFYGTDRNPAAAESLLTQSIEAWKRQPPDEQAGLYRVRGDCYMALLRPNDAIADYSTALKLLQGPGGSNADPAELPSC